MRNITQFKLYIRGAIAVLEEEFEKIEARFAAQQAREMDGEKIEDTGLEEAGVLITKALQELRKYLDYNF